MTLSVVGISGSVTRPSRTTALVTAVLEAIGQRLAVRGTLVELIDAAPLLFRSLTPATLDPAASDLLHTIGSADLLVLGTPVYRASYTGALKHLFDLLPADALIGTPTILLATAGSPLHGLVLEHQLRPLLSFFGALIVPTALYATHADFQDHVLACPALEERIARAVDASVRLLPGTGANAMARALAEI